MDKYAVMVENGMIGVERVNWNWNWNGNWLHSDMLVVWRGVVSGVVWRVFGGLEDALPKVVLL